METYAACSGNIIIIQEFGRLYCRRRRITSNNEESGNELLHSLNKEVNGKERNMIELMDGKRSKKNYVLSRIAFAIFLRKID